VARPLAPFCAVLPVVTTGAYHKEDLESYSSRHRRAPAAVITSASLDMTLNRHQSPPRPLFELDAAAAVDRVKPRASVVVFSTAGLHSKPASVDDSQDQPLLEISYSLVEPSIRTAVVMKQPLAHSLTASTENSAEESSRITWDEGMDPWQIDMAVRIRHPAWSMVGRPAPPREQPQLLHLNPSYNLVELRVTGVPIYMPLVAHSRWVHLALLVVVGMVACSNNPQKSTGAGVAYMPAAFSAAINNVILA
jgi:hypothetical protein